MLWILLAEEDNFVGAKKYQRGDYFFCAVEKNQRGNYFFCVDWEISGLTRLISAVTDIVRSCCGQILYWHQLLAKERAILTLGEPHFACGGSVYAWRDCMLICEAVFDCKIKHNQWGRTQRGKLLLYHSFQRSNWRGSVHFNTAGRIHCDLASF